MKCDGRAVTFETRREVAAVMAALDEWRSRHWELETCDDATDIYRGIRWLLGYLKIMEDEWDGQI